VLQDNGISFYVEDQGSGRPVLLLHLSPFVWLSTSCLSGQTEVLPDRWQLQPISRKPDLPEKSDLSPFVWL
jgi:hypothetical protein